MGDYSFSLFYRFDDPAAATRKRYLAYAECQQWWCPRRPERVDEAFMGRVQQIVTHWSGPITPEMKAEQERVGQDQEAASIIRPVYHFEASDDETALAGLVASLRLWPPLLYSSKWEPEQDGGASGRSET